MQRMLMLAIIYKKLWQIMLLLALFYHYNAREHYGTPCWCVWHAPGLQVYQRCWDHHGHRSWRSSVHQAHLDSLDFTLLDRNADPWL